jgi:uncharacterized protein YneF (UPF0154 family)
MLLIGLIGGIAIGYFLLPKLLEKIKGLFNKNPPAQ